MLCPICKMEVGVTEAGLFISHMKAGGNKLCDASGAMAVKLKDVKDPVDLEPRTVYPPYPMGVPSRTDVPLVPNSVDDGVPLAPASVLSPVPKPASDKDKKDNKY